MDYKINIPQFEGPLDLLLHLIKQSNINIEEISIDEITKQYLEYINIFENLNLNIASEYLVMAAELLEIKSSMLLPKQENTDDDYEEDPKENLIKRLIEYEQYKNITKNFKTLEEYRKEIYTKEPNFLLEYKETENLTTHGDINDLINAFSKLIKQKELNKPLNTKITNKEYSINKKCNEIKKLLKEKRKLVFDELFEDFSKNCIVITFLAILSMARKQEIQINQENNFENITIEEAGGF